MRADGGLRTFLRSLPHSALLFLVAVACNVLAMLAYAFVLLTTGINESAFYLASAMLLSAAMLSYFALSAIRTENAVELLAAVCIGTCVSVTIFYFRLNDNAFALVERRTEISYSSTLPPAVLDAGVIVSWSLVQLALLVCGYLSYKDFGWRIFKIFGIDFNMRQVDERVLGSPSRAPPCSPPRADVAGGHAPARQGRRRRDRNVCGRRPSRGIRAGSGCPSLLTFL